MAVLKYLDKAIEAAQKTPVGLTVVVVFVMTALTVSLFRSGVKANVKVGMYLVDVVVFLILVIFWSPFFGGSGSLNVGVGNAGSRVAAPGIPIEKLPQLKTPRSIDTDEEALEQGKVFLAILTALNSSPLPENFLTPPICYDEQTNIGNDKDIDGLVRVLQQPIGVYTTKPERLQKDFLDKDCSSISVNKQDYVVKIEYQITPRAVRVYKLLIDCKTGKIKGFSTQTLLIKLPS